MAQRQNILYRGGPGCGRTSALIRSASALIKNGSIEPGTILLLGPLKASVERMRRELQPLFRGPYHIRTLHSFI